MIMPAHLRTIDGVFEVHSAAVLGMSSAIASENFAMRSCSQCKKQLSEPYACDQHADAPIENRWIARLAIADDTGSMDAMIYHDALSDADVLPDVCRPLTDPEILSLTRKLRSMPWSLRLVVRTNEYKQQNYAEAKLMIPTLLPEGLAGTWALHPVPEVHMSRCCPFSRCCDMGYDEGLGVATCRKRECSSCRLWVRILEEGSDEETATADTTLGLRVTRRVRCAANVADTQEYTISAAGLSSGVQWLLKAPADVTMLVLAHKRNASLDFAVQAHLKLNAYPEELLKKYLQATIEKNSGQVLSLPETTTPHKRRKLITDSMPSIPKPSQNFKDRLAD